MHLLVNELCDTIVLLITQYSAVTYATAKASYCTKRQTVRNVRKYQHLLMLKKELSLRYLEVINFFTLEEKNQ